MKRFLIFGILALIMVFTLIPVFAEEATAVSEATSAPMGDTADTEDFNEIMTELYRHWQTYTETEGDNGFEKLVNFAWKYRGDVGGVVAAVSVIVFLLVMTFRFM